MNPCELCISETLSYFANRELSRVEMIQSIMERIGEVERLVNAFITVRDGDALLDQAREMDERQARGEALGRLAGIPIALKDNFATHDLRTTAGSKILADWHPDHDATVVRRLRKADAIIVGKLNMHEFADGTTTDNPHYGRACNPWDIGRTPAGSSGGSGAALAADMCLAATGTDTGGSIREPASFCGVVGLKPTFGLISRSGVVPFSWSLDHVGPMGRRVDDIAVLLDVMAGFDETDPASVQTEHARPAAPLKPLKGLRIGIETTFLTTQMQESVKNAFKECGDILTGLGATIQEVSIPSARYCLDVEMVILFSEAAVVHEEWLDAAAVDYGQDVRTSLFSGRLYKATDYVKAQRMRHVIRREAESVFRSVDALLTPTMIIEPPKWETHSFAIDGVDIDPLDAFIRCLTLANLLGYPAISVPAGYSKIGLPVGMQFIGRPFAEVQLIAIARAIEEAIPAWKRKPNLRS